jgi:hypothetical protein
MLSSSREKGTDQAQDFIREGGWERREYSKAGDELEVYLKTEPEAPNAGGFGTKEFRANENNH